MTTPEPRYPEWDQLPWEPDPIRDPLRTMRGWAAVLLIVGVVVGLVLAGVFAVGLLLLWTIGAAPFVVVYVVAASVGRRRARERCVPFAPRWGPLWTAAACAAVYAIPTLLLSLAGLLDHGDKSGLAHAGLLMLIVAVVPCAAVTLFACACLALRAILEPTDGACLRCGYDLSGLTSDRCPECGAASQAWDAPTTHQDEASPS